MSTAGILGVVLGTALAAGVLAWIVRRVIPVDTLRRHHEMGGAVFLQLGVIFAVLLAFVFNEVWTGYEAAAASINGECGGLHGAAMIADSLPDPQRQRVEQAIHAYIATVIGTEFPNMAKRRPNEAGTQAFERMVATVARLPETSGPPGTLKPQILSLLVHAHQERETRLFQLTLGVPGLVWALLSAFSVILIGFLFAFGIDYVASQVAFVAIFAAMLCFALLTVRLLDFPFEGPLRLTSRDFQTTLVKVDRLMNPVTPPPIYAPFQPG